MSLTRAQSDFYEWSLGDRMKKSLKVAGLQRYEMAEYLDVEPTTVSTWMNDRIKPSTQPLRLWAMKTGANYEWIATGCTPRDLNPEPTDSGSSWLASVIDFPSTARLAAA